MTSERGQNPAGLRSSNPHHTMMPAQLLLEGQEAAGTRPPLNRSACHRHHSSSFHITRQSISIIPNPSHPSHRHSCIIIARRRRCLVTIVTIVTIVTSSSRHQHHHHRIITASSCYPPAGVGWGAGALRRAIARCSWAAWFWPPLFRSLSLMMMLVSGRGQPRSPFQRWAGDGPFASSFPVVRLGSVRFSLRSASRFLLP